MQITSTEVAAAWSSLVTTGKMDQNGRPTPRYFPLDGQKDAAALAKEIRTKCITDEGQFKEGDLELSLDEKKLLKESLKRDWTVPELEGVLTLREKLEA